MCECAKEKTIQTNLDRRGVVNVFQDISVKEKFKQTNLDKRGVSHHWSDKDVINKIQEKVKQNPPKKKKNNNILKKYYIGVQQYTKENWNTEIIETPEQYQSLGGSISRPELTFKCVVCGNEFVKRLDYSNPATCKLCNPTPMSMYKSVEELEILDYIKSIYSDNIISGDRIILENQEIDIFIPNKKLAIEYCGLYWHSEKSGNKKYSYHYNKWKKCNEDGIQLLTVFSDEWNNKKAVVKNMIANKLGLANNQIMARKCNVSKINQKTANTFIIKHHIQNEVTNCINYGLYNNDILVAVMSFKKTKYDEYDLVRFCSSVRVQGGATKLLKTFINEYKPKKIISFSDNRYSNGNLYQTLNFSPVGIVPPMQYYVEKYIKKYHKSFLRKCPKDDLTEWEYAQSIGLDRIWDCGKIKWSLLLD
jgi:hypothetical protein